MKIMRKYGMALRSKLYDYQLRSSCQELNYKCCLIFSMCIVKWRIVDCFYFINKYVILDFKIVYNMNGKCIIEKWLEHDIMV